jgi:hypothetical protein
MKELEGYKPAEALVAGFVHNSGAALAQPLEDRIV